MNTSCDLMLLEYIMSKAKFEFGKVWKLGRTLSFLADAAIFELPLFCGKPGFIRFKFNKTFLL
jgi:hypothetical protein